MRINVAKLSIIVTMQFLSIQAQDFIEEETEYGGIIGEVLTDS